MHPSSAPVAMIQARMGSTRMPGKVLTLSAGKTFLEHTVDRLRYAKTLGSIVILTSTLPQDEPIADLAEVIGVPVFRGSESDVLDRYYKAAQQFGVDHIVRITADCPLIDPRIVDEVVGFAVRHYGEFDLVTNRYPLTFPDGMDVDAVPFASLERAAREAKTPAQREHVIPWFWETGQRFHNVESSRNLFRSHRWTVDYPEDAALVKAIFEALDRRGEPFSMQDILDFLSDRPDLSKLNEAHLPPA